MKNFFYIILFLPFISIGQNDVTPKIACDLITDYERAKEFTLKYLNTMPADKYSYKPTPEILSFREEALHLAGGNYRYAAMIAGGYDASNFDEIFKRPELQTKEGVIAWVDKSYDVMIIKLKAKKILMITPITTDGIVAKTVLLEKALNINHITEVNGLFT